MTEEATGYYHSLQGKKKDYVKSDLDSENFDFFQKFANEIEELRVNSPDQAEFCLQVVNSSAIHGWSRNLRRPVRTM